MLFQTVINGSSVMYRISARCRAAPAYLGVGWAAGMMETLESSLH